MALTDKDIIITPNRGQAAEPKIEFRGANASLGPQTISLNVYPTDNGTISFEGSAGQLFSITNSLSGSIYSVNDVSGIPSIEVLDTGLVKLAQYGGNVLIGTGTDNGSKLQINGGISTPTMWVNNSTSNNNDYNENIRLFPAGNNVSVIAFGATGISGVPWNSILGYSDRFEIRQGSQWQLRTYANYTHLYGPLKVGTYAPSVVNTDEALIGRVTDRSLGTLTIQLGNDAARVFEVVDKDWTTQIFVAGMNNFTYKGNTIYHSGNIPTWNQNTTGTASNVTGTVAIANGGTGATTNTAARTNLGATTVGSNLFTLANPSAVTFLRINADNSVSTLDAATFRSEIGAGTSSATGSVTSVGGTGTVNGLTLSGTVTTSGNLTLSGTLSASIDNITDEHRLFNNMGDNHGNRTSFDATTPSYNFGWRFITGSTNGPNVNSATQYYSLYIGLGDNYPATGSSSYGMQLAIPRNVTTPYLAVRYNENNSLAAWQKISAGYADSAGTSAAITNNNVVDFFRITNTGGAQRLLMGNQDSAGVNNPAMIVAANGNIEFGTGSTWTTNGGTFTAYAAANTDYFSHTSDIRAPIFYDSNNTNYYLDPASTSNLNSLYIQGGIGGIANDSSYQYAAVEIRERDFGGAQDDTWATAPRLSFHWGGRVASQIALHSSGRIHILNGGGTGVENVEAASMYGNAFYDRNDTGYYLDPASTTTSLQIAGAIEQGNNFAHPNIEWSAAGASTGMVIFSLPGTSGNYGMVHMVFDYYEYESTKTATIILGGHNWNSYWVNVGCNVTGNLPHQVRLGYKDGQYCVVFGGAASNWQYGTIRLRKIHNASFYNDIMNLGGSYSVAQTTTESFTNITGDLRELRTPATFTAGNHITSTGGYVTGTRLWAGYDSGVTGSVSASDWFRSNGNTGWYNASHGGGIYMIDGTWVRVYNNKQFYSENFIQSDSSVRAPIFYDSANTAYYLDPASTSNEALKVRGGAVFGPNTTWGASLYVGTDGRAGTSATVAVTNGNLHLDSQNGYQMYLNWYSTENIYSQGNFGVGSSSADHRLHVHGTGLATSDFRAPIFYDSNDTAYYVDPRSTSRLSGLRLDGVDNNASGDDAILWINKPNNNDWAIKVSGAFEYGIDLLMPASHSYAIRALANGSEYSRLGSDLFYHNSSVRAPIFYDSNNTNYYLDPAGTTSLNMAGSVRQATYNLAGLISVASGNASTGGSIAIQQETVEGWTGIFCDFEPYTGWGLWHDNPNNFFSFTSEASTGSIRSFTVPSRSSGNRTAYEKFRVEQSTGDVIVGRDGYAQTSFRAPIFYDSNDTTYYTDPASTSNINALQTAGQVVIGGTFSNTAHSNLSAARLMFSGGDVDAQGNYYIGTNAENYGGNYNKLDLRWHTGIRMGAQPNYGGIRFYDTEDLGTQIFAIGKDGSYAQANQSMRAPIFYDLDDTNYYGDFASTSRVNLVKANAVYDSNTTRSILPSGAVYTTGDTSPTGSFKIKLPNDSKSLYPMLSFTVQIYNYAQATSRTYRIGGHYSSTAWYNVFAYCLTDNAGSLDVRFGYDASNSLCVWIGETTTTWSYPQVFVTDFQNGYSAIQDSWFTGWSITLVTSFDTVTNGPYTPALGLNSKNYNSYSPTLTGTGASGTWGINISGNAATVTNGVYTSGDQTITGAKTFNSPSNTFVNTVATSNQGLSVFQDTASADAYMTFHIGNDYAAYFGLGGAENDLVYGGWSAGNNRYRILHSGNYNSYAPTLTGGGASGTWSINISGNAGSATTQAKTSATTVPASTAFSKWLFATTSTSGTLDWNDSSNTIPGVGSTLLLGTATNGPGQNIYYHPFNIEYSGISGLGNVTQMAIAYGSPGNELYMRGRYDNTWSGWVRYLNTTNYNSYAPTLTGTGASGTWGINITGNAATATNASNAWQLGTDTATKSNSLQYWQLSGNDTLNPTTDWHYALRMSHGDAETYYSATLAFNFFSDTIQYRRKTGGTNASWITLLHSSNYNSYAPTLTGTGASGTWGINITGNAATATSASTIDGVTFNNSNSGNPVSAPDSLDSNGIGYVTNVSLLGQTDGALYSQAYSSSWQHQIYGDYRTGQMAIRGKNSGTWQAWRTVLDSSNYNSYAPTLTGTNASGTWGISITGYSKYITYNDGPRDLSDRLPNSFTRSVLWDFVGAGTANGSGNYGGVMTFIPWTGTTASTGDSSYQLAFGNTTGANASGQPKLSIRNGIDTTWNAWYTILHSGNWSSFVTAGATITDDTTTNATRYLLFDDVTSGNATSIGVSSTKLYFNPSTGQLNATDFNSLSDLTKKENVKTIENATQKIVAMRGVTFDWIENKKSSMGVIAQEVEEVVPEVVSTSSSGEKSVNYGALVGLLIQTVKEQNEKIEQLEKLINTLISKE